MRFMGVGTVSKAIMVIDDDVDMVVMLESYLRRAGFEISKIHQATALWRGLQERLPDLIIMDVKLAGDDGLEICKQLRQNPHYADIPIIVLSAQNDLFMIRASYMAGANAYLN